MDGSFGVMRANRWRGLLLAFGHSEQGMNYMERIQNITQTFIPFIISAASMRVAVFYVLPILS